MAKKKMTEIAKEIFTKPAEPAKIEKEASAEIAPAEVIKREENKMSEKKAAVVKIKHRYWDDREKFKRYEPCELTGVMSIGEIGVVKINKGIVEIEAADKKEALAIANDIIEKTKEVVMVRNETTHKLEKETRTFWTIVE